MDFRDINNCYTAKVTDPNTGNSCWGRICIEDKLPPIVDFCENVTLACSDNTAPDYLGGDAQSATAIDACGWSRSFVDWVDSGSCATGYDRVITRTWTFCDRSGNCVQCEQTIYVRLADLFDVSVPSNYDGLDEPMLNCDEKYNLATDQKIDPTLQFIRPGVENPHFPPFGFDGCVDDYVLWQEFFLQTGIRAPRALGWNCIPSGPNAGHPSPYPIYYQAHWQWTLTNGLACFGPNRYVKWVGTGTPTGAECSNLEFIYEDKVFNLGTPDCDAGDVGCFKVLRQWTVLDWCTSTVGGYNQVIKVMDSEGPEVQYPDEIDVGMDAWSCVGRWQVPAPWLTDNCSNDIHYTVDVKDALVLGNEENGYIVLGLTPGQHTAYIEAYDCCGNRTVHEVTLNVIDDVPPTAVCDAHTVVSLTGSQTPGTNFTKIYAETFDDGSHDNCSEEVWFKVIRMDALRGTVHGSFADNSDLCSGIDGDDDFLIPGTQIYYDDYVKFCCEDEGNTVMVVFRVFDVDPGAGAVHPNRMQRGGSLEGRYNDCMVEVEVQNKSFPIVIAPDDVVVSCMFWFDDSEEALSDINNRTFGAVVTNLADRHKIKTDDLACPRWCERIDRDYLDWDPRGIDHRGVPVPAVSALACDLAEQYYDPTHPEFKYEFCMGLGWICNEYMWSCTGD